MAVMLHHRIRALLLDAGMALMCFGLLFAAHSYGQGAATVAPAPTTPLVAIVTPEPVSMLFAGDVMLDRGVARRARAKGLETLFGGAKELFAGNDAVVINFEGTLTSNASIAERDHAILRFTADPAYAAKLKDFGVTVASLANNHAFDFGIKGYQDTRTHLGDVGIITFGSPKNDRDISNSITLRDKKFCFVGYHDLFTHEPKPALTAIADLESTCDHVIVFAHWGDEYKLTENARQRTLAHQFIDAGADLIIGAHPHVVEPVEIYKGHAIFYSLGNFMFDQDFSYDTTHGLVVRVEWGSDATKFSLIPITVKNSEVRLADQVDAQKILNIVAGKTLSEDVRNTLTDHREITLP